MHIIAGNLKGRRFIEPKGHKTHPMSEKVRGGLFNTLGDIEGLTVLDAFAGSGALSFEAVSRGAANANAIEIERTATVSIEESVRELNLEKQVKVTRANISKWSDKNETKQFDLVLADPPYEKIKLILLQKIVKHAKTNGLFVLSWPGKLKVPEFSGLKMLKKHNYGDAQLVFYRRIS